MNSLFQQIYDTVVKNTNRPNLVAEITAAIQQETLVFHNRGRFRADVREAVLTSTNGGQLQYKFSIPKDKRIREILTVKPVSVNGQYGRQLPKMGLFDESADNNCGYSWLNGNLTIRLPWPATTFSLFYLEFPNINPEKYSSWIAETYPHYISDAATARVLILREKTQAQYYSARVGEFQVPGSHIHNLLTQNEEVRVDDY